MKQYIPLLAVGLTMLTACKKTKNTNPDIITTDYEMPQPQAPIKMAEEQSENVVKWGGKDYTVTIVRTPIDSLAMVVNEYGQEFIDNAIRVTITREDGSTFFNRTFTKSSFTSSLSDDYRRDGLLTHLRFYEADSNTLTFIACVNYPQATDDEATILELAIDREGGFVARRNDSYDMRGDWKFGEE